MTSFGGYLASVSTPIVQRALTGLGFGVVTYVGLDAAFSAARNAVISSWGAIPNGALTILSMSGAGEAVGIILGALSARLAMVQLKSLQVIK